MGHTDDNNRTEPSGPPVKHASGDADTMPAAEKAAEHERAARATIPDLAPPFEQRYRLGVELGRGGMGRVVEAFDTQLGRTVALKEVLPKGGTAVERRFEREVQITARLEHASIVPLYDAGTMPDGRPFYVMRRVTGRPLDELITRANGLPERLALLPNLLAAIDAVAHAHRRGIIHRDLKPANILVGELGETVVIDWGLAKVIGEESEPPSEAMELRVPSAADSLQTQVGSVFGTPGFMPPEQARGDELGPRSDVFALGATLYQLLVGRPPVSGKSATEAIVSSMRRRIDPVAVAAPGAPPELVAIVEKALAFEADDRYPNADKLGEDVRRFLTGQVVAAHRYTRRERISRFARRHRAPLSVAALATVAVAVLAWIGVHRIVVERDAATAAHDEAERQRQTAEQTNVALVEKNDSLVATKANALVDSNPTNAIAILKELRPSSARMADARAIARATVVRGVAWGLRCDGEPRVVSLNRDATRLALITTDGALHVWDLETHRVLFEHGYARNSRPVWVEHERLLIMRPGEAPDLFDPKTGVGERLAIAPSWLATPTDRGDRVAMVEDNGTAAVLELATRTLTPVWPGHKATAIAISGDGKWLAVSDDKTTAILDATGTEVTQHAGQLGVLATFGDRLAVFSNVPKPMVAELVLATRAWRDIPIALPLRAFILTTHHRGDALDVVTSNGLYSFRDGKPVTRGDMLDYSAFMVPNVWQGVSLSTGRDGNVHFFSDASDGTIMLPVGMTNAHLAGQPGHTRFIAAANGIVLVYDLAEILPVAIPKVGVFEAAFADDDTVLLWPDRDAQYHWRDLVTGETTAIEHTPNLSGIPVNIDPRDGRILISEQLDHEIALVVFEKGKPKPKTVARGTRLTGRLVPGGVLYGEPRDPRVMFTRRDEPGHELAKVDGGVQSLETLDGVRYAALGRSGEIVRGSLNGGPLDRTHVDIGPEAFLAADREGHVVVASGTRLLIWDGPAVRDLVKLQRPVNTIASATGGLIVSLDDNQVLYVEIGTGSKVTVHPLFASSASQPAVAGDGSWVASAGNGGQVTVIELPAMARWTIPIHYRTMGQFLVASPKRRLMQGTGSELMVTNLPEPSSDLAAWIEDRTNASETNDGLLTWPWQHP